MSRHVRRRQFEIQPGRKIMRRGAARCAVGLGFLSSFLFLASVREKTVLTQAGHRGAEGIGGGGLPHRVVALEQGSWHDAANANSDLLNYFSRIPTGREVNANHDGSGSQSSLASLPAAQAQKNLLGYFEKLPTHAVNADHDASRPPHPHPGATSSLVQYSDKMASDEMKKYYDSVPSHNVNAFHDAPSHVRGKARFATDEEAESDMDNYYDSIPTHIRKQVNDQTAHKAGVKQQSAHKAGVKQQSVSPSILDSGEADKGEAAVAALQKETVSVIQDFGDADMGDAAVAAVRKASGYDTNLGPTNKLKTAVMEETPGGPVETSIARSTGSTSTITSTRPAAGAQSTESAAMTPLISDAAVGRSTVMNSQEAKQQQQQHHHHTEAQKGVEEQGEEKKQSASPAVPHPAVKHHVMQAKKGIKGGAKRGSGPTSAVKAVIAEAAESHLSGLKQKYGNEPGHPGKGGVGGKEAQGSVGGGASMGRLNVRKAHEMHRRANKVGGGAAGATGSKHLSKSVGKMMGLGLCNVVGVGCS